jgi:hypothetical protein
MALVWRRNASAPMNVCMNLRPGFCSFILHAGR